MRTHSIQKTTTPFFVKGEFRVQRIAQTSPLIVSGFQRRHQLIRNYCGPHAALVFHVLAKNKSIDPANLDGHIDDIVRRFHVPTVQEWGTDADQIQKALKSLGTRTVCLKKNSLSSKETMNAVDSILTQHLPILSRIQLADRTTHWVNLCGMDGKRIYYYLDYGDIFSIDRKRFAHIFEEIIYPIN